MVKIDSSVCKIIVRFSFSNEKAVPEWISHHKKGVSQEKTGRKSRLNGKLVINPTENCSILSLAKDLGMAGYELVDAFCQKHTNPKYPEDEYQVVRFTFVRKGDMKLPDDFMNARIPVLGSLREMCADTMWRVRVFLNPYYKNGDEIPDKHAISINLESRQPLRFPEGPPIMVWPKDRNGRSTKGVPGAGKVALAPDYRLCIENNVISLVKI